jgi:D-alanine-D-alanine ligase-like ATP-grasp enzyme
MPRALDLLTNAASIAGSRGLTVVSWLDLARSAGPAWTYRRVRSERLYSGFGAEHRNRVYREIWAHAAAEAGAELSDLGDGFLELRRGGARTRVWQQWVELDDPVSLRLALDKMAVHRRLVSAGVRVPEHVAFHYREPVRALEFLARAGGPCVVKPARGTGGGDGTTAGVRDPSEFMRARLRAARLSDTLLIERQLSGSVFRLLLLDGEVLDVIQHLPPRLTGDGRTSIEGLLDQENERRLAAAGDAGLSLLDVGLDTLLTLARQGLTLSSVPAEGRTIAIQVVTNDNRIEDKETWRGALAPGLLADARRAVEAVGLRLAGVDVIAPDLSRPLEETGGAVAEVNGTPGIHHHYHVADRKRATRVAIPIVERILEESERQGGTAE